MPPERPPSPENEEDPSEDAISDYLAELEGELGSDRRSPAPSLYERPVSEHESKETEAFYQKACSVGRRIAASIDPDLVVSVDAIKVTPTEMAGKPYGTYALRFSHRKAPKLSWTMEIEKSDHYLEHEFENTIRRIYRRKKYGI